MGIELSNLVHPCYNQNARNIARMHVPIAPKCNIKCNYCDRKYDCMNESRPGVTSAVLTPHEGAERCRQAYEKYGRKLGIIGIAGPGDALSNMKEVSEFLLEMKGLLPVDFCLATNGLMLPRCVNTISKLGVKYVTVTVNAITARTAEKIYSYIEYEGNTLKGKEGAEILLENQWLGIKMLVDSGIKCKINTIAIKGVNDHEIEDIMIAAAQKGAIIGNITKLILVENSTFCEKNIVDERDIYQIRNTCEKHLNQLKHCAQCRADAVGFI